MEAIRYVFMNKTRTGRTTMCVSVGIHKCTQIHTLSKTGFQLGNLELLTPLSGKWQTSAHGSPLIANSFDIAHEQRMVFDIFEWMGGKSKSEYVRTIENDLKFIKFYWRSATFLRSQFSMAAFPQIWALVTDHLAYKAEDIFCLVRCKKEFSESYSHKTRLEVERCSLEKAIFRPSPCPLSCLLFWAAPNPKTRPGI